MPDAPRICHLTVLNPARHTRILYKLACSQAGWGWSASIIGQDAAAAPYEAEGVRIVPLRPFGRLSLRRLLAPWRILLLALRERADVYTVHTPELLPVALLLRALRRARLIYDMHEDYAATIRQALHYPAWLRRPLAALIRGLERLALPHLAAVCYAEACYVNVLGAPPERVLLLRNTFTWRAVQGQAQTVLPPQPYLLYTGTIAREWGVLAALDLWESVCRLTPVHLCVAGFTHDAGLLDEIRRRVQASGLEEQFTLIGGASYVPYADILHLIRHCRAGIALYEPLPHLRDKIPTKFYEFLALGRPLIYPQSPVWARFGAEAGLGAVWPQPVEALLHALDAWTPLPEEQRRPRYAWESDAEALRALMERLRPKRLSPP